MTECAAALAKFAFTAHPYTYDTERCRLISAHKNIQHEARYAELLQGRIKVSGIGM
jgi:hypothetical protein